MLAKIIGCFSIFIGVLWMIWPGLLRRWFTGKTTRYLFWILLGTLFYPLIHTAGKQGIVGWAALIIGFWVLMRMAGSAIRALMARVPDAALRAVGFLNILSGCVLLWMPK